VHVRLALVHTPDGARRARPPRDGYGECMKPSTAKAAIYVRVSTREQTTDNQLPDLEKMAEMRGLRIVGRYSENVSAKNFRPEFAKMLVDAHRGLFGVILIWALDRFGRSMAVNVQSVIELDRKGVQVISFREPWLDTGGPVRPLLIAIFSWVAEQERSQLVARTKAGLDHARKKGITLGRPKRRMDLERARMMKKNGHSLRVIAKAIGVPHTTLARALSLEPTPGDSRS
jgi:putative DNA-invertase from lambdoid prophage Rac